MELTRQAIEEFDLPYTLIESSEPAMLSELERAQSNGLKIIVNN
ncbi:hypothetical protein RYX56_20510 [Alkalihalophilus lindianensis]|uniref:Uncharacterized protein n=2 Tax=Alkalihalophilus lindianensis TaxID=1630542 RepID=A0ABU3XFT2_9BACI|nr:hypothetical protein [Alkalihalophilus lindianensis]MDV2686746.1 hypothetical protein [Alkalihalophilus lindianensis]